MPPYKLLIIGLTQADAKIRNPKASLPVKKQEYKYWPGPVVLLATVTRFVNI